MARPTVVILTGDPDLRCILEAVIEQIYYADSIPANNAHKAIEAVSRYQAELLIVDDESLEDDVQEIMHRLRADPGTRDVPVVALAGTADRVRELTSYGVDACLTKPFDIVALVDLVVLYTQGAPAEEPL